MRDTDVINRIKELCKLRGWSYYHLAKQAGMPHSTINNMLTKTHIPTVPTIQKICDGFGITLEEFFSDGKQAAYDLTDHQKYLIDTWNQLNVDDKKLLLAYMKGLTKTI